jgi:flagellar FliJ protein
VHKFVFSLETLLKHRVRLEEKQRERLAWIHYRLENEKRNIERLQARHSEVRAELAQSRLEAYEGGEVAWYYAFLRRLDGEIEQARSRLDGLKRDLEEQMAVWVERSKDKKVLEKLRSRKEREHAAAAEKLDQKAVDELVVTQFANKE